MQGQFDLWLPMFPNYMSFVDFFMLVVIVSCIWLSFLVICRFLCLATVW